jgi:hypothetical protein
MSRTRFDEGGRIVPCSPPLLRDVKTGAGGVLGVIGAHVVFKRRMGNP